eukprot:scaffold437_cov159-Amphora_coffeaeformis.AAC.14
MISVQSSAAFYLTVAAATLPGLTVVAVASGVLLMRRVSQAVGLAEPTHIMLEEEKPEQNCSLFRQFPHLTKRLAWRSLGACAKTPVHICTLPSRKDQKQKLMFLVKREDLISTRYGGNKVRTLQHQLAVCESRRDGGETAFQQLISIGTGGSNQVVATVVHAQSLGWDKTTDEPSSSINAAWLDKDKADLDNTLNMLSVLSFPNVGFVYNWGQPFRVGRAIRAVVGAWTQNDSIPMFLGGNCPAGILGQAGGILELAEQIIAGNSPDPERIYLPVGSGCTISGLILGTVLARHNGIPVLSHPNFKIVGCNVHPILAKLDRLVGLHVNPLFGFMPATITHSVLNACRALREIGGPNVENECMEFIKHHVDMRSDSNVVGKYGGHSLMTREAAQHYDAKGTVTDYETGREESDLWVCGHFVAKALHPLLTDLESNAAKSTAEEKPLNQQSPKYMLWMTKSAVQPRGEVDEWEKITNETDAVQKWANGGKAESTRRPGRVSTTDGSPEDYRSLMTQLSPEKKLN